LSPGEHATHFDRETEAMTTTLLEFFGRTGCFEKAVIVSDPISTIQSVAKFDTLPSKRVTHIHSSIKLLKGIQKDIKLQCILSHCGVVDKEIADYFAKKGTKISQTSACKRIFHSAKLIIQRSIQAVLLEYYAIQCQHKSRDKIVKNRNIIPDFAKGDAVVTFCLITLVITV
jgi:hypothetical protein